MINDSNDNRRYTISLIMVAVCLIYIIRLFSIQIVDKSYLEQSQNNAYLRKVIYPSRGLLTDRNGRLIVFNKSAYDIMIVPREARGFDTLAFANTLGITKADFIKRMGIIKRKSGYSPYVPQLFMSQLSDEEYGPVSEKLYKFNGIYVQKRTLREYNYHNAALALGSIGEVSKKQIEADDFYQQGDYAGQNGIELTYEKVLRGEKGEEILLRDSRGRVKGKYEDGKYDKKPVPGKDIELSLDIELQKYGEELMNGKIGSIAAIEPSTGEILALVSSPTYDPSMLVGRKRSANFAALSKDPLKPLFDRPMMAQYPPGSTFKTAQALVLQQEGIITPNTAYGCQQGFHAGALSVGCHGHESPLNLKHSIQHSCNAYYCCGFRSMIDNRKYKNVSEAIDVWKNHMVSLGFGYKLGADVPNEKRGYIPNSSVYNKVYGENRWKGLTIISLSIGQGEVLATPLQIANLGATIANRGYYYTPHLVKKIFGGEIDSSFITRHNSTIDPKYYDIVVEGMELVMISGTGYYSRIDSIAVCGKTGTAENPHGKDHSIFMAFAPKDDPKIAISVVVENSGFGATWAAPIATLMIEKYLKGEIPKRRKHIEQRLLDANLIKE